MDFRPRLNALPWSWGPVSPAAASTPEPPSICLHRAVDIAAGTDLVYRWICQLKVAPYSYDLLDNLGRRSPPRLTPGADDLAVGQRWLVFRITDFEPGERITGTELPTVRWLFGPIVCTYRVTPAVGGCRLTVTLVVDVANPLRRAAALPLAWGDLIMMRKQLLTIKHYAERDQAARQ